jgi:hypothetical protein
LLLSKYPAINVGKHYLRLHLIFLLATLHRIIYFPFAGFRGISDGKKIRALDAFGKDLELLRAISDPIFDVCSISNKELQNKLKDTSWAKGMSDKQLSGRISRHLLLLRQHGLIKKLPNQRKYSLTDKGRKITASICVALASSVNDLLKLSA